MTAAKFIFILSSVGSVLMSSPLVVEMKSGAKMNILCVVLVLCIGLLKNSIGVFQGHSDFAGKKS